MMHKNLEAFLQTIRVSELGADLIAVTDGGYNVIVGSTAQKPILFSSYADHPRRAVTFRRRNGTEDKSTAAGAYQILGWVFDAYKKQLGLPDFGKASQDKIALQLIKECHATDDIVSGRLAVALAKCKSRWASLPGAGYGQNEHPIAHLQKAYLTAGGVLA